VCSWYRSFRHWLVCPTYACLQVLHVSEYMPLLSYGEGGGIKVVVGLVSCEIVLLLLKATLMLVFLKRLVIFLMRGEVYVKVAHFVLPTGSVGACGWLSFCCVLRFSFVRKWVGMLLLCAICLMFFHLFCLCTLLRESESILLIESL
jgi:hypothetical protein